jgi:hypothetical protein
MPSKGVLTPRRVNQLPYELTHLNTTLDRFITIASDSADRRTFGFRANVSTAQQMIKRQCGFYGPSQASDSNAILCSSGETDGNPRCGSHCFKCLAGQFSASGFFTGEMTDAGPPAAVMLATQDADDHGEELPY